MDLDAWFFVWIGLVVLDLDAWFFVWIGLFVALTIQDYGGFLTHKSIFQTLFYNYVFVRKRIPLGYVITVLILNDFDRFGTLGLPDPVGKCEVDLGRPEGGIGFSDEIGAGHAVPHFPGMKHIQNIQV